MIERLLPPNRLYWGEPPDGEWLPEVSTPLPAAWKARLGSRWLCINDHPESYEGKLEPRTGAIGEMPERPGYVMWSDGSLRVQLLRVIDDNEAGMTVQIAVNAGRDLVELRIVNEGGEERLHVGTSVYRRTA